MTQQPGPNGQDPYQQQPPYGQQPQGHPPYGAPPFHYEQQYGPVQQYGQGQPYAGGPQYGGPPFRQFGPPPVRNHGLTIAAMVLGIIGVALAWIPFIGTIGFLPGAVGLVLGIVALVRRLPSRGLAITGVVTGGVAVLMAGSAIMLWASLFFSFGHESAQSTTQATLISESQEGPARVTYLRDREQLSSTTFTGRREYRAAEADEDGSTFTVIVRSQDPSAEVGCRIRAHGETLVSRGGIGMVQCVSQVD